MSGTSKMYERKPPAEGGRDKDLSDGSESGGSAPEMRLADLSGTSRSQFLYKLIKALPDPIQDRIIAVQNLQLEILKLDSQFQQEVFELEKEYHKALQPLYNTRAEIINGVVDPLKEEPKYPVVDLEYDEDNAEYFSKMLKDVKAIPADAKGIPNFWLTVLKSTMLLADRIKPYDEPVLKELRDLKIVYEKDSFIIEFYFGENNYFTNTKLTKQYFIRNDINEFQDPFIYLGPEYIGCKGCYVDWKPKMKINTKTIIEKQKQKSSGAIRYVTKQVDIDSFFEFFDPQIRDESSEELDHDIEMLLHADFKIGRYLRSWIISRAVLFYTGDLVDGEDGEEGEDDEEEEDDDDDGEYVTANEMTYESDDPSVRTMPAASKKYERTPPAEGAPDKSLSDGSEGGDSAPEMRLADLNGASRSQVLYKMIKALPDPIQDRIVAVQNLQLEILKWESQFQQEVFELEKEYHKALQPLYDKRAEIINGVVDPLKEEPKYPVVDLEYDEDNAEDFSKMLKDVKAIPADAKGIPNFWLTVLKSTMLLADRIKPYDEPVLKELRDVKIVYEKDSFIIEFYFGENNYFTNTKLTKQYFIRNDINEFQDPFTYLTPVYIGCKGCYVDWKPKMKINTKTIIEKQKQKSSGAIRYVTKQVDIDSFFEFFDPQIRDESSEELDRDIEMLLHADFEIGDHLRFWTISRAVLIYTGDLIDGEHGKESVDDEDDYDYGEYETDVKVTYESDGKDNQDDDDDDDGEYVTANEMTYESDGKDNVNGDDDDGEHVTNWGSTYESDDGENQNDDDYDCDCETDFYPTDKSDCEDIGNDNKTDILSSMTEQSEEQASQPDDDDGEHETHWDLTDPSVRTMPAASKKYERKSPAEGGRDKDLSDGSESGDSAPEMRLADLNGASRSQCLYKMIKALPDPIQDRIVAAQNLQLEILKLDSQFQQEVFELEKEYHKALQPLYNKRAEIINGVVDPLKEEPKYPVVDLEYDEDNAEDFSKMLKDVKAIPADAKGIPNFWLTVLKSTMLLADRIKPYDEPVLKELRDVRIVYEKDSFIIEFYFGENNYFTNTKLTKQYFIRNDINEFQDPFIYLGPEYIGCKGCYVDWKPKMKINTKTIIEKQKQKSSGAIRYVTKQVDIDSFFEFFDPQIRDESSEELDHDIEMLLHADFEIGRYLRSWTISRAVLFYTGDLIDGEHGEEGEDDEEEEDDDDDGEYVTANEITYESDDLSVRAMSAASKKYERTPPAEGAPDKSLSDGSEGGDSAPEMRLADLNGALRSQVLYKMIKALPDPIQDRIIAVQNLQLEILKLESQLQQEVFELEREYHKALQPLYDKRAEIINGVVDPLKEEPKYPVVDLEYDEDNAEDFSKMLKDVKAIPADAKGIPNFWLTVLKSTMLLADRIKPYDEPVLKELRDVRIVYEKDSFIIEFYFGENNYFTNTKLTKQYFIRHDINEFQDPFTYLTPVYIGCKGCYIDWKPKMKINTKTIIEKQKQKSSGAIRYVTKQVDIDSFFEFFDPQIRDESSEELDHDIEMLLHADFEIGDHLRSWTISRAVLIYTGDLIDGEDGDEGEDDVIDEEEEDDYDYGEYETDEKVTYESYGEDNENDDDDDGEHVTNWGSTYESDDGENQNDDDYDCETDFYPTDKSDGEDIGNDNKTDILSIMTEQTEEQASQPDDDDDETDWVTIETYLGYN